MPLIDPSITASIDVAHIKALGDMIKYPKASLYGLGRIARKGKLVARKAYKTVTAEFNPLEGGLAEGDPDSNFNMSSIKDGMNVEREHTKHKIVQKRIAKDHLKEDPKYYEKLKLIERKKRKVKPK